jgi:purine-cytosine permease-like protein
VLSTITTTFLDAYSAGVSTVAIFPNVNEKHMAILMTAIGLGLALWVPMHQYEHFLYAIGSVFGPLFAIVLTDYFVFKTRAVSPKLVLHVNAMGVWIVGVGLYYVFKSFDWSLGSVLPTMIATALLFAVVTKAAKAFKIEKEG